MFEIEPDLGIRAGQILIGFSGGLILSRNRKGSEMRGLGTGVSSSVGYLENIGVTVGSLNLLRRQTSSYMAMGASVIASAKFPPILFLVTTKVV